MKARMSLVILGAILCAMVAGMPAHAGAGDEAETAELLIILLKTGRAVVSEHQALINDASKGNKGFTDKFVGNEIIDKFKAKTRIDLARPIGIPQSALLLAMLESEREVVLEAQPVINKQGIAFKGFIPSVFARKVGQKFFGKTGIKMKLTGVEYRFAGNKPDDFEAEVLRMFTDSRHPKGQQYAKVTMVNGKPVMRVMDPEYADGTCLACHGGPKGERDITGMKKEGWKEGELAGAISVVMPMR
jgi:general secretion pathway protein A